MTDLARVGPEGETPVNPYSLLEAVNDSSDTAHTAWLIFLAVMTYLMIAVAGVTHKDLLLETPVSLPVLQVDIQLTQFFQFAPVVLVLMHLGVVSQLVLLARKTLEFDHSIRMLETTERRTHPLRLEINNFFFVQAIAGPHRSAVMSGFLHTMSWLTLVILPVVLILFIQVVFLPYHDVAITWTHRAALLVDIAVLILIGVFLMRAETSFFQAFVRTTLSYPISFLVTSVVLGFVALFSLFVATVPGEDLDKVSQGIVGFVEPEDTGRRRQLAGGFALPFLDVRPDGTLFGFISRNLVVTDTDLVPDKDVVTGDMAEPTLNLRGRDLRYAKLDRSDMHQADLTGATLDFASLIGTNLRRAWIQCVDATELLLTDRDTAKCPSARRANFSRALLSEALLVGLDLRGANMTEAKLDGAALGSSLLSGTTFIRANLDKADLAGGIVAHGANFLTASLQGADLTGAQLQAADFSNALLQGTIFNFAQMQGADLRDVDLEAASLYQATLFGADMTGAKIVGADLRNALVWMTKPPQQDGSGMADLNGVVIRPLGEADTASLQQQIDETRRRRLRERLNDVMAPLLKDADMRAWASSPDLQAWQAMITASAPNQADAYRTLLTDYLTSTMCKSRWSSGAMATGVARRAMTQQFRGDLVTVYDRLKVDGCPASKTVGLRVMKALSVSADAVRPN